MDKETYGLPGSVVIIGLVYAIALAIAPAPSLSAQVGGAVQTEYRPNNAATGRPTPPLAMPISDERTGFLRAHAALMSDSAPCVHIPDAAGNYATLLHTHFLQPQRTTAKRERAIAPAPPDKLTFF